MMTRGRIEAFSDGVIAILITIMVLELKVPHGTDLDVLRPLVPAFLAYALSFVLLGIYWTNHHHLFHTIEHVTGGILWANLNLLFWLSLVPFVTGWIGENHMGAVPTAAYGSVLLACALSYLLLQRTIIRAHGRGSRLALAVQHDAKGKLSLLLYALAVLLAFVSQWTSDTIFVAVALLWLVPDRRIESKLREEQSSAAPRSPSG